MNTNENDIWFPAKKYGWGLGTSLPLARLGGLCRMARLALRRRNFSGAAQYHSVCGLRHRSGHRPFYCCPYQGRETALALGKRLAGTWHRMNTAPPTATQDGARRPRPAHFTFVNPLVPYF